ncbi:serine hydrolase [Brevibacillus daliensis]|uniref:serine hydrolase n=1 Tax=Brevibacillus daliensis TaxID=2892995 RepID=UPI001E2879B8|nr:serine hydrolase [Brevibacillus daliensis]
MFTNLQNDLLQAIEGFQGEWGVVVEDIVTAEKFSYKENDSFYAASLIKVPVMSAVFAGANEGRFAMEDILDLRAEDLVGGAGVLQHMTPGTPLSIQDLVTLMIIQSDNTATNMLIELVGKDSIHAIMEKTGMNNSAFYNKLMVIPADLEGVNSVTPADMTNHYRLLAQGKIISYDASQKMLSILKKQQVRDVIPGLFPDPDHEIIGGLPLWELANKTGNVTNVQHDTGILYIGRHAVLLSFLSKGVENSVAKQGISKLGKMVFDYYQAR